jgi:hypothetical protein
MNDYLITAFYVMPKFATKHIGHVYRRRRIGKIRRHRSVLISTAWNARQNLFSALFGNAILYRFNDTVRIKRVRVHLD